MRVITWNMGLADRFRRFASTHEEAWRYLLELDGDVVFVQEALPPTWVDDLGAVVRDPFRKWGSLVFSPRRSLRPVTPPDGNPLATLPNYLAFAEADLSAGEPILAASIHAPPRLASPEVLGDSDPSELRRSPNGPRYNDAIFQAMQEWVQGRRFIAAGDWNTGRTQGSDAASAIGAEFFRRVADAGWLDCSWEHLGREVKTWFGHGSLVQDDYVFTDPSFVGKVRDVYPKTDAVERFHYSDHAPLVVELELD